MREDKRTSINYYIYIYIKWTKHTRRLFLPNQTNPNKIFISLRILVLLEWSVVIECRNLFVDIVTMRERRRIQIVIVVEVGWSIRRRFAPCTLLVAPSSSSLLSPRPSFLLAPPSPLFLFLPRPALSQSLKIHKRPFFIDFDESVTNQRTNGRTDQRTEGHGLI